MVSKIYTIKKISFAFAKWLLLQISPTSIEITTISSLFKLKVYNISLNRMLVNQQSTGGSDEWPTFLVNHIPGLKVIKIFFKTDIC